MGTKKWTVEKKNLNMQAEQISGYYYSYQLLTSFSAIVLALRSCTAPEREDMWPLGCLRSLVPLSAEAYEAPLKSLINVWSQ